MAEEKFMTQEEKIDKLYNLIENDKNWSGLLNFKNKIYKKDLWNLAEFSLYYYFNPKKHQEKSWWKSGITEENVLLEFTLPTSPISPKNLISLWKELPLLQKIFYDSEEFDFSFLEDLEEKKEKNEVIITNEQEKLNTEKSQNYFRGELTFSDMTKELNDISSAMASKLFLGAAQKIKTLTGGIPPEEMSDIEYKELISRIAKIRYEVSREYADKLKTHGLKDIKGFLEEIGTGGLDISEEEIECLLFLSIHTIEEIVEMLLIDIDEDNNIFKTYQNMVSKKIFPHKSGNAKRIITLNENNKIKNPTSFIKNQNQNNISVEVPIQ